VNVGQRLVQQSYVRGRRVTKVEEGKRESIGLPVDEEVCCDVLVIGTEGTGARASVEAPARVKELLDWGISPGREPVLDAWGWR